MINAWRIEIVIPMIEEEQRSELFDRVVETAMDWQPENRTWDVEVSAHGVYDYLYDTRSFKFNVGDRVRVTVDKLAGETGVIQRIKPGEDGRLPYDILLDGDEFTVPFEEDELELEN